MPALSCGQRCLQIMLIVFNIVVFICGIALVAVGLVACISLNRYSKDIDATVYGFAVFLIVLGVVIFFLGIIGCCGACNESVYKLTLYSLLLFVIIVSEFASSVGALVLKEKVKEKLTIAVKDAVQDYNKNPDLKSVVDEIQEAIGCCGADSPSDYDTPPQSCYDNGELFKTGCIEAITLIMKRYMVIIAVCTIAFGLLQILAFVFAICLCGAIKRNKY